MGEPVKSPGYRQPCMLKESRKTKARRRARALGVLNQMTSAIVVNRKSTGQIAIPILTGMGLRSQLQEEA